MPTDRKCHNDVVEDVLLTEYDLSDLGRDLLAQVHHQSRPPSFTRARPAATRSSADRPSTAASSSSVSPKARPAPSNDRWSASGSSPERRAIIERAAARTGATASSPRLVRASVVVRAST